MHRNNPGADQPARCAHATPCHRSARWATTLSARWAAPRTLRAWWTPTATSPSCRRAPRCRGSGRQPGLPEGAASASLAMAPTGPEVEQQHEGGSSSTGCLDRGSCPRSCVIQAAAVGSEWKRRRSRGAGPLAKESSGGLLRLLLTPTAQVVTLCPRVVFYPGSAPAFVCPWQLA